MILPLILALSAHAAPGPAGPFRALNPAPEAVAFGCKEGAPMAPRDRCRVW